MWMFSSISSSSTYKTVCNNYARIPPEDREDGKCFIREKMSDDAHSMCGCGQKLMDWTRYTIKI